MVPGDVFILENNMTIPCDAILISGETMMNECALTG